MISIQKLDTPAPVLGVHDVNVMVLQQAGESEDVSQIVVNHEHRLMIQYRVMFLEFLHNGELCLAEIGFLPVHQSDRLSQKRIERGNVAYHGFTGGARDGR
jgi:hypothetical protein